MTVWVYSRYYANLSFKVMTDNTNTKWKTRQKGHYNLRQTPEMSCQEYFERVRNIVEVIKIIGGSLVDDMHLADELPPVPPAGGYTAQQFEVTRETIRNKKIAYGKLVRADRGRYGKLIEEVENAYLKGNNNYPRTPTKAYNLLVNYRNYSANKRTAMQEGLDQVALMGHYKSDFQEKKSEDAEGEDSQEVCQFI